MKNRDVEALWSQYEPLRNAIFAKHMYKFGSLNEVGSPTDLIYDSAGLEDLRAYIDTEFTRLVLEYDINGPIDFPGYIYKKLGKRVIGTHLSRRSRGILHETAGGDANDEIFSSVEDPTDYSYIPDEDTKEYLFSKLMYELASKELDNPLNVMIGDFMIEKETSSFPVVKRYVLSLDNYKDMPSSQIKEHFTKVAQTLININFS